MKKLTIALALLSVWSGFSLAYNNKIVVAGASAQALRVLDGVRTRDGEFAVRCSGKTDEGTLYSMNLSLRWRDDADGNPFFVELLRLPLETSAEVFAAMPEGAMVDPLPYVSGGVNPVLEVRTLGANDETMSVILQCARRRYFTECLFQKATDH